MLPRQAVESPSLGTFQSQLDTLLSDPAPAGGEDEVTAGGPFQPPVVPPANQEGREQPVPGGSPGMPAL